MTELTAGNPAENLAERLQAACARYFGEVRPVENIRPAVGGGSSITHIFDWGRPEESPPRLVLRQETLAGPFNIFIAPEAQFKCMQVAHGGGVAIPKPHFLLEPGDGLGAGFVMDFVAGEAIPRRILRDAQCRDVLPDLPAQLGEILGTLHSIDTAALNFLGHPEPNLSPALREIEMQRRRLDSYGEAHPALELVLRWLEAHAPQSGRPAFVHGDFRNGNFIVGPEGIRSVLDWELCHVGDGLEDLGWLCIKAWRYGKNKNPVGGFGTREDLFEAYAKKTGASVDPENVFFWEVYGTFKWAMINILQAYSHLELGRRSPVFAACGRNVSMMEYDLLTMIDTGAN